MAWLRLTQNDGRMSLVNTDQSSITTSRIGKSGCTVWSQAAAIDATETVDEIAAMIEAAEWRERVLRCACAIMSNEHANGLTSEQVWARAARFAAMEPERPVANT